MLAAIRRASSRVSDVNRSAKLFDEGLGRRQIRKTPANLVLAGEGPPPVTYDDARRMISGGARRMIERALVAEGPKRTGVEAARLPPLQLEDASRRLSPLKARELLPAEQGSHE